MPKGIILNATQHVASPEQADAGVENMTLADQEALSKLLTFDRIPDAGDIEQRARAMT